MIQKISKQLAFHMFVESLGRDLRGGRVYIDLTVDCICVSCPC